LRPDARPFRLRQADDPEDLAGVCPRHQRGARAKIGGPSRVGHHVAHRARASAHAQRRDALAGPRRANEQRSGDKPLGRAAVHCTIGEKDGAGAARRRFTAALTLNRRDFGLAWGNPLIRVADDIRVALDIQATPA
jgi:hypothetical protein